MWAVSNRTNHGGRRAGSGRPSIFGATALAKPYAMDFTAVGRKELARLVRRTGLSRNAVLAILALKHADALVFTAPTPFPDKARNVLSIRVPPDAGAKLTAARIRTGYSYSDIGEALVRWYGASTRFPSRVPRRPRRSAA